MQLNWKGQKSAGLTISRIWTPLAGKYTWSQKKAKVDIKVACLFCDQVIRDEESREAMTFKVNSRALESARLLKDEALLAKLSAGDVMAQEVKYHPNLVKTNLW